MAAGLFPAGKQKDRWTGMGKLIVASGGVLQKHSVLDHVIIDSAELCLLSTVILGAEAMSEAQDAFYFIVLYTRIFLRSIKINSFPFLNKSDKAT